MRDTEGGFIMCRPRRGAGSAPRPAVPNVAVEGISAEQQDEAIEEAVDARLAELQALLEAVAADEAGGGEDDE